MYSERNSGSEEVEKMKEEIKRLHKEIHESADEALLLNETDKKAAEDKRCT